MDRKLRTILEEHRETIKRDHETHISQSMPGVFLLGVLTGIIVSYSGVLGICVGIAIGTVGARYSAGMMDKLTDLTTDKLGQYITYKKIETGNILQNQLDRD